MRSFFYLTLLTLFFHKAFCGSTTLGDFVFTVVGVFDDKTGTTDRKFWYATIERQDGQKFDSYVGFGLPEGELDSNLWTANADPGQNQFRFFPTELNQLALNMGFSNQSGVDSPNLHQTSLKVQVYNLENNTPSTPNVTIPTSEFAPISF